LSADQGTIALIFARRRPPTYGFSSTFQLWSPTRPPLLTCPSIDSLRARASTHELSHASTMARLVASAAAAAVTAATLLAATPSLAATAGGDDLLVSVHEAIANVKVLTLAAGCGADCQAEVTARLAAAGCDRIRPFPRLRMAAARCAGADVFHASGLNDTGNADVGSSSGRMGATLSAIPGVVSVDDDFIISTQPTLEGAAVRQGFPPRFPWPGFPQPGGPGFPQPGGPGFPQPGGPGFPQPGGPGRPQPGRPGRPQPGRPGRPQPGRPGRPQPGRPGRPQPGRPGRPQPGRPDFPPPNGGSGSWGIDRVNQAALPLDGDSSTPCYPARGRGVTIYVVDSGCAVDHEQFGGRATAVAAPGSRFRSGYDDEGHGSHCAGTAAGRTTGVATAATVVCVKVLDSSGRGSSADIVAGFEYAAERSAASPSTPAVVSASLGARGSARDATGVAAARAVATGLTFVAAAGNDGADACGYSPAGVPSVVTVANADRRDRIASTSNRGRCIDVAAPGTDIVSVSHRGGLVSQSGTSMAAPHVAGLAALVLAEPGGARKSSEEVLEVLTAQAPSIGGYPMAWANPQCGQ